MEGYDVNFLEPEKVVFERSSGGVLTGKIDGKDYDEILLYRTFPHSSPYEYISVRNNDEEIGVIQAIGELEQQSQDEAIRELHLRYLVPVVQRINSLVQQQDLWTMKIETDRGAMTMGIEHPHDHIVYTKKGGLLITDLEGRRCEIREVAALDKKSMRELNKMI